MMKKDLFDIIREKSFEELTDAERAEVSEMAGDAEAYTCLLYTSPSPRDA